MSTIRISSIDPAGYRSLAALLAENDLLSSDLDGPDRQFFAFEDESGWRVGVGGLEIYGEAALLRSFLTMSHHRGQGLGGQMLEELLSFARGLGVRMVYLFTETADAFFAKHGFEPVQRASAPEAVKASRQFAVHCKNGVFMRKILA